MQIDLGTATGQDPLETESKRTTSHHHLTKCLTRRRVRLEWCIWRRSLTCEVNLLTKLGDGGQNKTQFRVQIAQMEYFDVARGWESRGGSFWCSVYAWFVMFRRLTAKLL